MAKMYVCNDTSCLFLINHHASCCQHRLDLSTMVANGLIVALIVAHLYGVFAPVACMI